MHEEGKGEGKILESVSGEAILRAGNRRTNEMET